MTNKQAQRNKQAIERMNERKKKSAERIFAIQMIFMLVVFLAFATLSIWAIGEMAIERNARYNFQEITMIEVQRGDTLWNFAETIRTCQRQDLRQIVFLITQINEFDGSVIIREGDVIALPVFDSTPANN